MEKENRPKANRRSSGSKIMSELHKNMYHEIEVSLKGVSKCAKELLNLSLRAALDDDHTDLRTQLKELLVNCFGVKSAHHVDIEGELEHTLFWQPVQNSQLTLADASLVFSRTGSSSARRIERLSEDKHEVLKKLGMRSKSVYKYSKKYEFVFLELADGSWTAEQPETDKENGVLSLIFRVYCQDGKSELSQALMELAQAYVGSFKQIAARIIKNATRLPFRISALGVEFEDDPIFSLIISNLFHMAHREATFISGCFTIMRSSRTPYKYMLYARGEIVYSNCTGEELTEDQLESLRSRKIQPKDFLQAMAVSVEVSKDVLQKVDVDGSHSGINNRWSIRHDKDLGLCEILIVGTDTSRRTGFNNFQSRVMLNIIRHMKKNVIENTIGNQFIPGEHKTTSSSTQSPYLSRQLTIDQRKPSKSFASKILNVVMNPQCEQRKLIDNIEFNALPEELDVVCNLVHEIMITRFNPSDFDADKLVTFIQKVGFYYQKYSNPFHNMYHCFTVLHGAFVLSKSEVFVKVFDSQAALTFLVAAICHDLKHTGVNNAFEEKTQSRLANRYGDRSILENYSISKALKLFSNEETNFLPKLSDKSWKAMRRLLVSTILATDNKNHTLVLSDFQPYIYDQKARLTEREPVEKVMGALLHACDFWGNVKEFKISRAWAVKVNQEFSKQYERELSLKLEVTPYFKGLDDVFTMAKNEHFFISAIVYPLYKKINQWSEGYLKLQLSRVQKNLEIWKIVGQTGKLQGYI